MVTQSENSDIAILQTQMIEVKATLSEIKTELQQINGSLSDKYTTKEQFESFRRVTFPVTILITAIITGLVVFFFQNIDLTKPKTSSTTTTSTTSSSSPGTGTPGTSGTSGNSSGTPSATATSNATSTPANPSASDTQSSGGTTITVPLVQTPKIP